MILTIKKITISFLAMMMLFGVVGCSTKTEDDNKPVSETENIEANNVGEKTDETTDSANNNQEVVFVDEETNEEEMAVTDLPETSVNSNSIAMLNHLTFIAEEVNQSKNSKMFLEDVSFDLLNNLYPNVVDKRTQNQVSSLFGTISDLKMITEKRERLAYIYEQNKANAMRSAVPSPMSMMNVIMSGNLLKSLASAAYLVVDSYTSYQSASSTIELEYLKDNWKLDDDSAISIKNARIDAFNYMHDIVRDNNIEGDLVLNEQAVNSLVQCRGYNVAQRLTFLESKESVYSAFGGYWLLLAQTYYENGDYKKCTEATDTYIKVQPRIFRYDTEFASIIPFAIASLPDVYSGEDLTMKEKEYVDLLDKNTTESDWSLKYCAAMTYLDLYGRTGIREYLETAYDIAKNNVAYAVNSSNKQLIKEQQDNNEAYKTDVKEKDIPKYSTKEQKNEIENYNKMLKEVRKTELPPVSSALLLNMQLLFSLADELNISEAEKATIQDIIHDKGDALFLTETIDNEFWFGNKKEIDVSGEFDGSELSIPATYVCSESRIEIVVSDGSVSNTYGGFEVKSVKRKGDDPSKYTVVYKSPELKGLKFKEGFKVTVLIYPYDDFFEPVKLVFDVVDKGFLPGVNYVLEK